MRVIKCLSKQMCDEIEGSLDYAINAIEYRESDPELANLYHRLAETEYEHAMELHKQAVKKVEELEVSEKNIPNFMLEKWQNAHKIAMEKAEEAKVYLDLW